MKKLFFVLLAMLLIPGLSLASGSKYWEDVETKAKQEGTLRMLTSLDSRTFIPMAAKFLKNKYGITLENQRSTTRNTLSKIKAESASGTFMTDIITLDPLYLDQNPKLWGEWGYIPELDDPKVTWHINPKAYLPGILVGFRIHSLTVNTNLVPKGTEPKTWKELADPKWRGKIFMADFRVSTTSSASLAYLTRIYGEDWLKQFLKNDPIISRKYRQAPMMLQRGEFAIYAFCTQMGAIRAKEKAPGIPTHYYHPNDGVEGHTRQPALVNNAPHPNAARVLLNWMLSKEGQTAIGKSYDLPNRAGIEVPYPEWQDFTKIKIWKPFPPDKKFYSEYILKIKELCTEITGK